MAGNNMWDSVPSGMGSWGDAAANPALNGNVANPPKFEDEQDFPTLGAAPKVSKSEEREAERRRRAEQQRKLEEEQRRKEAASERYGSRGGFRDGGRERSSFFGERRERRNFDGEEEEVVSKADQANDWRRDGAAKSKEMRGGGGTGGFRRDYDDGPRGGGDRNFGRGGFGAGAGGDRSFGAARDFGAPRDRDAGFGNFGGRKDRQERGVPAHIATDDDLPTEKPYKCYIGNLSFSVTEDDIGNFLIDQDIALMELFIHHDDMDGRFKGSCDAELDDLESVKKLLALDGVDFLGRSLRISVYPTRRRRQFVPAASAVVEPAPAERKPLKLQPRTLPVEKPDVPPATSKPNGTVLQPAPSARPAPVSSEPRQRKKLELKPRSEQAPPAAPAPEARSASIFGGAQPVDNTAIYTRDPAKEERERKEREKKEQEKKEQEKKE
eukprot:CAMPEP_0119118078 /NCGR_PEP_ID=MMETSP1310-20130426/15_1 /TAXON_ID=464262 /ORGANISM="Genus nov. species nov., Strain RCC2339" /LENGTH=438 /DNA_ID=CAMNT_0007107413 /DNA_START=60 /DNA_END=1373 /DNA_ORIENTATION=-